MFEPSIFFAESVTRQSQLTRINEEKAREVGDKGKLIALRKSLLTKEYPKMESEWGKDELIKIIAHDEQKIKFITQIIEDNE